MNNIKNLQFAVNLLDNLNIIVMCYSLWYLADLIQYSQRIYERDSHQTMFIIKFEIWKFGIV